jgi:hypothetical protein
LNEPQGCAAFLSHDHKIASSCLGLSMQELAIFDGNLQLGHPGVYLAATKASWGVAGSTMFFLNL